ncbi:orotate phosphoribosyltransferase [Williamsoniiplasma lucivorax]|uniref:Orotate phosphoribosyltransferase n=1 Tax=Williamsoniiplasma lucivorax TaxID=209274 RepID=A0A2S5R9X7_9MOLU|nr:orotate phosphoribosyltransferase [Williamsoniiplasma lucivorax]PPE04131.1 orotate phosphoribosyltransferase [Williamsoniiplasma lucivorax]
MHKKQAIIQALFKAEAIQLNFKNYFTWTSGIKSPIYCDTRLLTGDVRAREKVVDAFIESINKNYPGTKLIAGVASSGISWAAMIAQKMRLPMVYVRSAAKGYGAGRQIEGIYQPQQKVVVIEDLISTGSSCLNTVTVLQAAGLEVLGVQSIMTYGLEKAKHNFENHATILNSLVSVHDLIDYFNQHHLHNQQEIAELENFLLFLDK